MAKYTTAYAQWVMLVLVRYVLPAAIVLAGFVVLIVVGGDMGAEGWSLLVGSGLSVALLNVLYRAGVSGDADRKAEDDARRYFDEHGHWPDEAPR